MRKRLSTAVALMRRTVRRDRRLVSWEFTTTFSHSAPNQPFQAGDTTLERIVYDPSKVDADGNVVLVGHAHYLHAGQTGPGSPARWSPTPVSNLSVFNVDTKVQTYDVQTTHAGAFVFAETPFKVTAFYSQEDGSLLMLGHYEFSSDGPQPYHARP